MEARVTGVLQGKDKGHGLGQPPAVAEAFSERGERVLGPGTLNPQGTFLKISSFYL